ncbi:MAG: FmdE family protein [Anaerolineaceae bacterium]
MPELVEMLENSSRNHSHLCPKQILGVRIGLAGTTAVGLEPQPAGKRLVVILECYGCFADGVIAATGCCVGHRNLRVEDYGKVAATFVNVETRQAVRVTPKLDVRERALKWASEEPRHYFAQMQAYQIMPDEELLNFRQVELKPTIDEILSRPGLRVNCDICGEEITNEREIIRDGQVLCKACAGRSYYRPVIVSASGTIADVVKPEAEGSTD